jgi:hypothetical protein
MTTSFDLANRALALAGTRSTISDFTSTPEGLYCGLLYNDFRDFMLRQGDYDFSMAVTGPTPTTAVPGWAFAYQYPANCVRVRQLLPVLIDPFDPQPVQWNILAGVTQLIVTTLAISDIIITSNAVIETFWDSMFTDSFVRLLSSGVAMALENRLELHKTTINEALQFAAQANVRDS